jgi:hypothetical protein
MVMGSSGLAIRLPSRACALSPGTLNHFTDHAYAEEVPYTSCREALGATAA